MGLFGTIIKRRPVAGGGLTAQAVGGDGPITGAGTGSGTGGLLGGGGGTVAPEFARSIANTLGNTAGIIPGSSLMVIQQAGRFPGGDGLDTFTKVIKALDRNKSGDVTNVAETSIQNGQFVPVMDSGVHKFRPEIILSAEFNTIWEPGEISTIDGQLMKKNSATGDFISFQFQTKQLRQETLGALIKNIQKALSNPEIFKDVKKDYDDELTKVGNDLGYLENIVSNIAIIKNAFNIKNIPVENYESKSGDIITRTRTLRQIFEEKMQYNSDQFNVFSSTKVLLQMLFDLEHMLSAYSVGLLNQKDADRANDYDPTVLDRTYTTNNGFSFSINTFSSLSANETTKNAADSSFFTAFMSSLPPGSNDRIKLLTYLLAKEYSVSRGLGDPSNAVRLQAIKYNTRSGGSPFKNIIGAPGNTIFEGSIGIPDSLASLMKINPDSAGVKILTFENKFVDSNDQQFTYIPGTSFFTDSILTVDGSDWKSNALTTYINRYNTIVRDTRTLINDVFGFDESATATTTGITNSESSVIDPIEMNKRLLQAVRVSYGALVPAESSILEDLNSASSAKAQSVIALEYQISLLNAAITAPDTTDAQRTSYSAQLAGVRTRLDSLNLPTIDDSLKISLDKSTLMAIFKFVSSGHDELKLLLFQFCLLSGMMRNSTSNNLEDIFSLMAETEIDTTAKLSPYWIFASGGIANGIPTDNGANLIDTLKVLSETFERLLLDALNLLPSAGTQYKEEGSLFYYIKQTSIQDLLYKCALGEGPAAEQNLIYQFVNLTNQFFNSGRINGRNMHLVPDGSNVTKYNYLSTSVQSLFVFEILCQYAMTYSPTSFTSHGSTEGVGVLRDDPADTTPSITIPTLGLSINFVQMNNIDQAIQLLTTSVSEEEKDATRRRNNKAFLDLESNKNKIASEYETIKEMMTNLKIIGDHLQSSLTQVQGFFNQKALQDFLKNSPVTNLNLLKNYSQLRLASYIYNDIKERTQTPSSFMKNFGGAENAESSAPQSDLIVSETTTESEYNALVSFLSDARNLSLQCIPSDSYPADMIKRNNKILAVGIPAGFSNELADRVNKAQITAQTFQDKPDVIVVNVFIRNLKFNDLVFKPLKYVFDLSLFATRKDFVDCNAYSGESIDNILERISLTDLENPFGPQKINTAKILADSKYDFLSTQQKNDLVKNHVSSYLLNMYIQYITGVKTTEEIFLEPSAPPKQLTSKSKVILDTYIKQTFGTVPNRSSSIRDIITANNLPEGLKDAYRLLTYGSIVFCENETRSRVLTPKLFDRIFYVPVNVDNAEIDMDLTRSTASGQATLSKNIMQPFIRTSTNGVSGADTKYYLDAFSIDDFIINDMFVAVETANDTVAQDTTAQNTPATSYIVTGTAMAVGTVNT